MKRLLVLFVLMLAAFAGCNSSTDNDNKNDNTGNNTNNTGNGGTFKVTGAVKLTSPDGAGISGAAIKLTGANTNLPATTGSDGSFTFNNIANGTYVVTITKANYTFAPNEVPVTVNGKDVVVQTFVGTTSGNPGGNTGDAGSHTYFPLKLGASWTFDSTDNMSTSPSTYTDRVIGTQVQAGKTYWIYASQSIGYGDTTLFRIENNVLYGFFSLNMFMKPAPKAAKTAKLAAAAKALVSSYGAEMPLLNFGQSAGSTWTIYDSGVYEGSSVKVNGKYAGTENVTVPAGSFTGCRKYEVTIVITLYDTTTKTTETSTDVSTEWLASGVGLVKASTVSTAGSGKDAYTYTSTDVLKAYSIP